MVQLTFVGPWKDSRLRELSAELEKRVRILWKLSVEEAPSDAHSLGVHLEKLRKKGAHLISVDPIGDKMDSNQFARWVTGSSQDLVFVVWGPDGPPEPLRSSIPMKFSLSPMTTSHELARVFLMEQIYRSACVLKGHPYPK